MADSTPSQLSDSTHGRTTRLFPPPIGWIPATVAIIVATIAAAFSVAPQFRSQPVAVSGGTGGTSGTDPGQGAVGPVAGGGQQQTNGTGGTAGHTVTVGGTGGNTTNTTGGGGSQAGAISCAGGHNGGATAPGVTARELHVASTIVSTGIGSGFLGEAVNGMQAAVNEVNTAGGLCGRHVVLDTVNSGWDRTQGANDISSYISGGNEFALVGEPDSEGLDGAVASHTIDQAGMPVVGTDGMLKSQYNDPWVWPVAASTVTNMHVIADYAVHHLNAHSFGIVYDTRYRFGAEGATAFDAEVARLTGKHLPGSDQQGCGNGTHFCGISADQGSYSDPIVAFDAGCTPCDVVVMLLEPAPMQTWMSGESQAPAGSWYKNLFGGEPLFDDQFAGGCGAECGGMTVWTGYHAAIQPFDSEPAVAQYVNSLKAACPRCDPHNEFTEGAYLGTRLFITAVERLQAKGLPLTRATLRDELNSDSFDLGIAASPVHYGSSLPHISTAAMAAFSDNAQGSFNGWNYLQNVGFVADPARGSDVS